MGIFFLENKDHQKKRKKPRNSMFVVKISKVQIRHIPLLCCHSSLLPAGCWIEVTNSQFSDFLLMTEKNTLAILYAMCDIANGKILILSEVIFKGLPLYLTSFLVVFNSLVICTWGNLYNLGMTLHINRYGWGCKYILSRS